MDKSFQVITNCSKQNKKAISNIPFGEIVDEYYFRHYKDRQEYWNDTRICLVKCKDFREVFELVKWLRANCTRLSVKPREKIVIGLGIKKIPFTRPIIFNDVDHNPLSNKMIRTYHFPIEKEDFSTICERRNKNTKILLNNPNDVIEVLNGDLDLLNLARELS